MSQRRFSKSTERIVATCVLVVCVCIGCLLSAVLWALLRLVVPPVAAIAMASVPGIYFMRWNWRMSKICLLNSYPCDDQRTDALDLAMFGPEKYERVKRFRIRLNWREFEYTLNK